MPIPMSSKMIASMTVLCFILISLLDLVQAGLAPLNTTVPGNVSEPGNEFDFCDGQGNYSPVLYHNYTNSDCKPENDFDWMGLCEPVVPKDCNAFCQQNTYFSWAQESPFPQSYCNYPLDCALSEDHSTSWNWGITVSPKVGKMLKVGVSGGYGQTYGTSYGRTWRFKPVSDQCGYFSFIPVKKTSCGVVTQATYSFWGAGCFDPQNSDYCASQVSFTTLPTGKKGPDGTIIFVYTDCNTRQPMPADKQNPIYNNPGVALDRGVAATIQQQWAKTSCEIRNSTSPDDTSGFYNFTTEIYGNGLLYSSVGNNGSGLAASIAYQCGSNLTASPSFTWYDANNTLVNNLNETQPDGSVLPMTPPSSDFAFGTIVSLSINETLVGLKSDNALQYAMLCVELALINAGATTASCTVSGGGTDS